MEIHSALTTDIPEIVPVTAERVAALESHFQRHRAESGGPEGHFMPFDPDDPEGPKGLDAAALGLALTDPGWQRWWAALDGDEVIGHVNLKGPGLRTILHRCELGIGIERYRRGGGLGRRLMAAALDFARAEPSIDWVDLMVMQTNTTARALYESLGFTHIGTYEDRFRIQGKSIGDVMMTLSVAA